MASPAKASNFTLTALTWNIEGIRRNIFTLAQILEREKSSLVFLGEIQAYQCDIEVVVQYISHEYCYSLNSEDSTDPELPLYKSKAKGGTMLLWRKWLDPHIKVISVQSSAFLPIVLTLPDSIPSIHVSIYLPTHEQDTEFVSELAKLTNCLDNLLETYLGALLFIRGDANVNIKNTVRVNIIESFKNKFNLTEIEFEHNTYHHFVGEGLFDSKLDVIYHNSTHESHESVTEILCNRMYPSINSHHDIILSTFSLLMCLIFVP